MSISLFRPRYGGSLLGEMMRDLSRIESSFLPPNYSNDFPSEVTNDKSKFAVNLNVSQFKPENLKINLDGRKLTIEGNEEIENDHGYSKRSFSRLIYLPEDVDLSAVSSNLTNDGKLSIEAPKLENYSTNGRNIPIQQKNIENSNEKNQ